MIVFGSGGIPDVLSKVQIQNDCPKPVSEKNIKKLNLNLSQCQLPVLRFFDLSILLR